MITIDSIGGLIETVVQRVRPDNRILWFRGHHSSTWNVQPSIWRDYDKPAELNFTNRFSSRAGTRYEKLPEYNDAAGRLSLMQHYGLPTRLLDWTRSPLIAAYFALEKYIYNPPPKPEDASIWVLEPHKLNVQEGFDEITPPIDANMCRNMLTPAFTHKDHENNKVMAVMAAEQELRMFVQQGCFTIHSYQKPLNERKGHEEYLLELRIPAKVVREMAFNVDVCGFRQGDIFPDLEHLSSELKGIYRPKR